MTWDAMVFTMYIVRIAIAVGVIAASLLPILVIGCVHAVWFDKLTTIEEQTAFRRSVHRVSLQ